MNKKEDYDFELEIKEKYTRFKAFCHDAYAYSPVFYTLIEDADNCFRNSNFSRLKVCLSHIKKEVDSYNDFDSYSKKRDTYEIVQELKEFCEKMIEKGYDNSNCDKAKVKLTEKEELKIKKSQIDQRLKEIQEIKSPYLNFSLGLSFILISLIFLCIPNFFIRVSIIYHLCGFMLSLGVVLLISEVNVRYKIGWVGYSDKITNKRAFIYLLQASVYILPLAVLYIFFSNIMIVKILFFIQLTFCSIIMINGLVLLIVASINKKEKKFSFWGFIMGFITIAGFLIQILQLFNVL